MRNLRSLDFERWETRCLKDIAIIIQDCFDELKPENSDKSSREAAKVKMFNNSLLFAPV